MMISIDDKHISNTENYQEVKMQAISETMIVALHEGMMESLKSMKMDHNMSMEKFSISQRLQAPIFFQLG